MFVYFTHFLLYTQERAERARLEKAGASLQQKLDETTSLGAEMKAAYDQMVSAQAEERAEAGALARQVSELTEERNRLTSEGELLELRLQDLLQVGP